MFSSGSHRASWLPAWNRRLPDKTGSTYHEVSTASKRFCEVHRQSGPGHY